MTPAGAAQALQDHFGDGVLEVVLFRGETTVLVVGPAIADVSRYCRDKLNFDFLSDLTCVDWPNRPPRFDLVYHLLSVQDWKRLRLKCQTGERDAIPTVTGVWGAADWAEREIFDLFGVQFSGHPDLRRIMMPVGWIGYPLRKDYAQTQISLPRPKADKTFE